MSQTLKQLSAGQMLERTDLPAGAQGRSLPAEQVLPLLRKQEGELCCQYLEYLVVGRGSQVPEHHTELALSLASAALQLMPPVDDRYPLSHTQSLACSEGVPADCTACAILK